MTKAKQKTDTPTAKDILKLYGKLSLEERKKLEGTGSFIAEGADSIDSPEESIYGVPCVHCNKIALRLLGTSWSGQPAPPTNVPLRALAWTQDRITPNRLQPRCQWCHGPLRLSQSGTLLKEEDGGFVHIERWEKMRDEAFKVRPRSMATGVNLQGTDASHELNRRDALEAIDHVATTGTIGVPGSPGAQKGTLPRSAPGHTEAVMSELAKQSGLDDATAKWEGSR